MLLTQYMSSAKTYWNMTINVTVLSDSFRQIFTVIFFFIFRSIKNKLGTNMTPNLSDRVNQQYYLKYGACYESIIIVKYLLNFKQVGIFAIATCNIFEHCRLYTINWSTWSTIVPLDAKLRPTCDRKILESWANRRRTYDWSQRS